MDNQNKQLNDRAQNGDLGSEREVKDNLSSLKDKNILYIYKKTERLSMALYVLSNLFDDREPMRHSLREAGLDLISISALFLSSNTAERLAALDHFVHLSMRLISYIEIARAGNLITPMNYDLLKNEFEAVIALVKNNEENFKAGYGSILAKDFFAPVQDQTSYPLPQFNNLISSSANNSPDITLKSSQGLGSLSHKGHIRQKDKTVLDNTMTFGTKQNRSEIIISMLKKDKVLTIKDFLAVIKDCSEKTVQRELLALVAKGILKKEGERRWSKYSLI